MQSDTPPTAAPQEQEPFPPDRPRWSLAQGVSVLVLYVLLQAVFMTLRVSVARGRSGLGFQIAATNIALLFVAWAFLRARTGSTAGARSAIGLRLRGSARRTFLRCLKPVAVAAVALTVWALGQMWVLKWMGVKPAPQDVIDWLLARWHRGAFADAGIFIATAVSLTPIAEEAVFRGFLYLPLRSKIGRVPAALLVSALFAAVHFYPTGLGHLLILALTFTWLVEATGTLWAPIAAHALHNALMIVLVLVLDMPV